MFVLLWGGVEIWKWVDGEGPPALRPDTDRLISLPDFFNSVRVEQEKEYKLWKFVIPRRIGSIVSNSWFWIY